MSNIFETLKTNQLFKILEEERDDAFENEEFFQGLKDLHHLSKNWALDKKHGLFLVYCLVLKV